MSYKEVYDNPNYSHIMIGGQPFFILPSGELSDHVPVPVSGETLTPRNVPSQHHIYQAASSTYRSTSDYDTDSSNFRPELDRVSDTFPPIYEEIDKYTTGMCGVGPGGGGEGGGGGGGGGGVGSGGGVPPWLTQKSLSPRSRGVTRPGPPHCMYYYSDTFKRRPGLDMESLQESDSGLSSR